MQELKSGRCRVRQLTCYGGGGGGRRLVDVCQAPAGGRTWRCTGRHSVLTAAAATTRSTPATLHTSYTAHKALDTRHSQCAGCWSVYPACLACQLTSIKWNLNHWVRGRRWRELFGWRRCGGGGGGGGGGGFSDLGHLFPQSFDRLLRGVPLHHGPAVV